MRAEPRVVHVVPALFGAADGIVGGAERYALELARHMADQLPTTLVTFGAKARQETLGALAIRVVGRACHVRGQRTNPIGVGLFSQLRAADIVHCHQQHVVASSVSALVSRALRRQVYVTELGGGGWDISSYISTDRWFHAHLHISNYSRAVAGQVDWPSAHVVFGGVDTVKFSPDHSARDDGPVVFVGRLLPHKGIDYLIQALPSEMRLDIIGRATDPGYARSLQQLAAGKQVRFYDRYDDDDLVRAYRSAACVVLPSVYRSSVGGFTAVPELLGQTLLEAMACGIPTICTNVASMPEIVVDGVTGLVVPPNDPAALGNALRMVMSDPDRRRRMGHAGRRRVLERFTWPAVVERCLTIYGVESTRQVQVA
jgi:glycosyltransferase involved in cell wall biosynthesis